MWQRAGNNAGGGTPTFSINEYDLHGKTHSFPCKNAFFVCGMEASYSQYLIGYLENGVVTILYNYSNFATVTYANGVLTLSGTAMSGASAAARKLKIMYE